jgi:hypothetical protein
MNACAKGHFEAQQLFSSISSEYKIELDKINKKICSNCEKKNLNLLICSRCKKVACKKILLLLLIIIDCNKECQSKDWKNHKNNCI